MRLEDCSLNIDLAITAPVKRTEPEESWVQARDTGTIPVCVFDLYTRASYLSFGTAPRFLADEDNILFSYFGMLLTSLGESLVDADEQVRLFVEAQSKTYDPGKKIRGEPWDPDADEWARRHFKYLLLSLQGALDALAGLIAVFLPGLIPSLRLGRAQFSKLEAWLDRPLSTSGLVLTPQEDFLMQLYDTLRPLVHPDSPERDWLPLMRMFRNKAAHLGDAVFSYVYLHDRAGRFHAFLPREWPYILEKHMKPAEASRPKDSSFVPALFRDTLVHQDVVTYVRGLRAKVSDVIVAVVSVLNVAYDQFKEFPLSQSVLAELLASSEAYTFEYFPLA
ncbi:hypothetical protein E3J62_05295 [candidate division TA06 bacterium]|uniref:Uncharacterized protein n=1 Tax=candidate division TA06 bacterium TaxID=2250710 RepID=A0A523UU87_UNCT6|nr:MAG: hypothetical protein E3J62_05295 [candidate division TA06 bacterium]